MKKNHLDQPILTKCLDIFLYFLMFNSLKHEYTQFPTPVDLICRPGGSGNTPGTIEKDCFNRYSVWVED